MSALALPISELMPVVDQAKEQTKSVVVCSHAQRADTMVVCNIVWKTFVLKHRLADVARRQEQLIAKLLERDFSATPMDEVRSLANSIDQLVTEERELLSEAQKLGSEIRVWWNTSLVRLSGQVEHLDSIAESLHLECDDKASALLAFAVEQFAMK